MVQIQNKINNISIINIKVIVFKNIHMNKNIKMNKKNKNKQLNKKNKNNYLNQKYLNKNI